jgi:outer membrane murein-binding lipoprotein Lpp
MSFRTVNAVLFSQMLDFVRCEVNQQLLRDNNFHRCLRAVLLTCAQRAYTTVAVDRQGHLLQLQSLGKFGAVARRRNAAWNLRPLSAVVQGPLESTTQKGKFMNRAIVLKVAAVAVVAGLAGCQDMKPLQADVAELKSQVAKLQSDVSAAKSSADQANSTAQSANQAASSAQSTANQALAAAQASQSAVDATNEKIDRMFKRSISK